MTKKCNGSGRIASRPDLATQLTDGLADSGLNLKEGVFFEVTEVCPGCDQCVPKINTWRDGRKRKVFRIGDKRVFNSHVVWNRHNPDDKVKKGENIHHVDGDSLNDNIENLQKMTRAGHTSLHRADLCREGLSERAKLQWKNNPPKKIKWDRGEALRLKDNGMSWRAIAKELGLGHSTVWDYFRRNPCKIIDNWCPDCGCKLPGHFSGCIRIDPTECSYWRLKRDSPSVTGFKCGVCDICNDEGDQILMRRKEGE